MATGNAIAEGSFSNFKNDTSGIDFLLTANGETVKWHLVEADAKTCGNGFQYKGLVTEGDKRMMGKTAVVRIQFSESRCHISASK